MYGIDMHDLFGEGFSQLPHLWDLFARMSVSAILGACLAYRCWRPWLRSVMPPIQQVAQAQTMIAAASSVLVVVIGDHPARAFGLVGIGSFIRFRSGISDPRDAANMFLMIGIGMACGLGLLTMAIAASLFFGLCLIAADIGASYVNRRITISVTSDDPPLVCRRLEALFPGARTLELTFDASSSGKDSGKFLMEIGVRGRVDATTLQALLVADAVPGVRRIAIVAED
jgi:uncharacterized protein YneF (UPF0154 family)